MKLQLNFWLVLKRFLIIFLPLLVLVSCSTYYIQTENAKRERRIFQTNEIDLVNLQIKIIVNSFKSIKSDLIVLTGHTDILNLIETGDMHHKKYLAEDLLLFCDSKGIYDQVRFLDEQGMEVVRVNYNTGNPYIVLEDQLQSKKDRYYFKDTFKLDKGEVFVSPFDLNIERGKIEKPLKPMIRFGTTVFDSYGQKRGIVVLNYLGENLINELKLASENIPGHIMLLNSNGYWLHGVKPEDEWGFMYEDRKDFVFGNTFPEAWQQISTESSGHFYNADGLFTYTTVYPLLGGWKSTDGAGGVFETSTKELNAKEYTWKIVSYVAPDILSAGLGGFTIILISIYGFVIVLIGCGSWFLASSGVRRRIAEERITSFAHILDESLNEIYIFDAKTLRFVQVNEGARLNLGYSMEELSILTPLDLEPEFTAESFAKMVKHLRAGENKRIEFTTAHRRKDGSLYDVEVHLQLSIFQSTPAFVAIILDITERKRVEEKMKVLAKFPSENPNPVLRIEKNGTILFANNAGSIFLDNWSTQTGQPVPEDWHKHVLDVLHSGKSKDYEIECNNHIFSLTLAPVVEEGYVNFYGLDITERKKAEEELRQYDHIVSCSADMLALLDKRFIYSAVNQSYLNAFNKSREDVVGHAASEVIGKAFFEKKVKAKAERCLAGNVVSFQEWFDLPVLGRKYMDVTYSPYIDVNNEVKGFVVNARNITERKRVEEQIKGLARFPSENPNPVLRVEKNGTILFANNAGSIFFDSWSTQTGQPVPEDWHKYVLDVLRSGTSKNYEMEYNDHIYSLTLAPVVDEGYVNFYGLDITERKNAEEQIKASLKEKEVLLMEIHHRVKNNMQVIASLLRLQSEEIKDKQLLALFNESLNRIKSMALIHEDLYQDKNLANIAFDQYTRKLTGRLMKSFGVNPDRIITDINIDNVFLGVDKAIPCGLIINELFTNSLKYAFPHIITDLEHIPGKDEDRERSKNKEEICINLHSNNDVYTLVFSDNGVGLPEDIDFHKTETLGLELVRTLVKQLKGTIEINSNSGTEFKITFSV